MTLRTHLLAAARFGPYAINETVFAKSSVATGSGQRARHRRPGLLRCGVLIPLATHGANRHWLTRAEAKPTLAGVAPSRSRGRPRRDGGEPPSTRGEPLAPAAMGGQGHPLPATRLPSSGTAHVAHRPEQYPATEISALYHERWEIELGYDEVKTKMLERQEAIRSRRPAGIAQELWGVALAYNLVRLEMVRIAEEAGVPPNQISFVMALRLIRDEWLWCAVAKPRRHPASPPRAARRGTSASSCRPGARSDATRGP